jgi:hypothetical protein
VLLTESVKHLFEVLYSFHVYGFLFLPFLFAVKPLTGRSIADRAVRYLAPYAVFYLVASVMFFVMYRRSNGLIAWAGDTLVGLVVASPKTVQKASGFQLFWFLPALFSLTVFRSLWVYLGKRTRVAVFVVFCVLQPAVGGDARPDEAVSADWGADCRACGPNGDAGGVGLVAFLCAAAGGRCGRVPAAVCGVGRDDAEAGRLGGYFHVQEPGCPAGS